ncbi:MAG: dihydrofolate reductase family protein [Spirochaetia bacterium]|jgi:dihydrofolate reductase
MRKLIASTFLSLDGFTVGQNEDMGWVMNNFNEEMGKYAGDLMSSMDAILLGRVTYQIMINFWPANTEATAPGADKMNNTPKVVFSRTLDKADWGKYKNARVVKDNVAQEIAKLKQQPGKNMVIYGSANLVQGLTRLGLIDEYQILVHPILLGAGKPLFAGLSQPVNLKLTKSETYKNGVVVLYYQPK